MNSPEIRAWLGATVGKEAEDLSRHDKWLCMMYPPSRLLREFLTEDGAVFASMDDISLRMVLDARKLTGHGGLPRHTMCGILLNKGGPMRYFIMVLSFAAFAGVAHANASGELKEAIAAFVVEEIENLPPEMRDEMVACILPVFDGMGDAMVAQVLAEDDFEKGLGVILTAYPEREQILEECEKLDD